MNACEMCGRDTPNGFYRRMRLCRDCIPDYLGPGVKYQSIHLGPAIVELPRDAGDGFDFEMMKTQPR